VWSRSERYWQTGALVERELCVEAVEPGCELVEVARRRVGESSARFHAARFDDVELLDAGFDAVFSPTAFHWVDPAVGWSKAARRLRPGDVLALLTYVRELNVEPDIELRSVPRGGGLPEAGTWEADGRLNVVPRWVADATWSEIRTACTA
jgi:SAM-dependent methyltransferase